MKKDHNYGICRICGRDHGEHPKGALGKHWKLSKETIKKMSKPKSEEEKKNTTIALNRPEYKEIRSNISTELWKDPAFREKRMKTCSTFEYKTWQIKHLRGIRFKYPSKPQIKLFNTIKSLYPNEEVVMDYLFERIKGNFYLIDIAVPKLKLGFEYDGHYWHKESKYADIEKDKRRHKEIESQGWTLIHYEKESEFMHPP